MRKAWIWSAACVLAACSDDDPPALIRGTLSCARTESTALGRRFDYELTRFYDDSVLVIVTCGVTSGRGAASRLFAASELGADEGDLELECEVVDVGATPVAPYQFRFTPHLDTHSLRVTVNNVVFSAAASDEHPCTATGSV